MDYHKKYLEKLHQYAERYNAMVESDNPIEVVALFSQNRIEVRAKIETFIEIFEIETLDSIKNFVSLKEDRNDEIKKASEIIRDSLNQAFPYQEVTFFNIEKQTLKKQIKDYWKAIGKPSLKYTDEDAGIDINWSGEDSLKNLYREVDAAYKKKEEIEHLMQQADALGYIIEIALLNDYPKNISKFIKGNKTEKKPRKNPSTPGPNTPKNLVIDIEKILKDASGVDKCYDDGKIVIDRVLGYALDQKWFEDKWGIGGKDYSRRHLQTLFSRAIKNMKS